MHLLLSTLISSHRFGIFKQLFFWGGHVDVVCLNVNAESGRIDSIEWCAVLLNAQAQSL